MSSITKVSASSSDYPRAESTWQIDLDANTDGIDEGLVIAFKKLYNNAIYDLVFAAAAKVGWEISKLGSGQINQAEFEERFGDLMEVLGKRN